LKVIDHSILEDSKKTFNCLNLEQAAPRGGLLLHKPSTKDKDRFQLFVQPLIQYVEDVPIANLANDAWKQHMIQIHNKESPQKRRRAPRGGVKRKCGNNDEDELIWSLENVSKKKKRKEAHSSLIVGEDGARALEYLQLEHDGNVITAELNALVDLTAGKGMHYVAIETCIPHIIKTNFPLFFESIEGAKKCEDSSAQTEVTSFLLLRVLENGL
jgi:hypothetical protein